MFRSVLVAVDGSRSATAALEAAVELARSEGARLTLISVAARTGWRFVSPYVTPYPSEAELEREAERIVARAEAFVPDDVSVSTVVRQGPAAREILARVEAAEHDLVVLGSRGRGPARSLLLGSVSRAVLDHSPVPVLIVRGGVKMREDAPTEALAA
jgi:nucleotide-binding universal stress UspA family protein